MLCYVNSFVSIKASHCVFELSVPCVYVFHCVIATEFDYRIQYNWFRVELHAVDSLNVKHELLSKKIKQFCIMQTFPNDICRFATLKSCFRGCLHEKTRTGASFIPGRLFYFVQRLHGLGHFISRYLKVQFMLINTRKIQNRKHYRQFTHCIT